MIFSANCLTSRIARGALFLKVTPYKRLLIWIVYSRVTMSLDFVLVSGFLAAFTIFEDPLNVSRQQELTPVVPIIHKVHR